ncbi:MAG: PEP-CTERM sorting domain-containing protein [Thermodesulfobacteriota bacterium]|nr:MAG: PEP-CTERM sorting domain-containing protein [Thermodesulfobacteriota bacterium]
MKRFILAFSVSFMALSGTAFALPQNFGFETGDTTGWTETYPQNFGKIDVVADWTGQSTIAGASERWTATYKPVEGNYFAVLETGEPDRDFTMLSQRVSLNRGDKLEGWATFCCGSEVYYPYQPIDADNYNDYALISILNSQGNIVDVPWYADSFDIGYRVTTSEGQAMGEINKIADFGPLPWEHWSWTAPAPDSYTLQYKVTQGTDAVGNSYAFFDGTKKKAAVPEPSSMILLGLAGAGVFAARRFSQLNTGNRLA